MDLDANRDPLPAHTYLITRGMRQTSSTDFCRVWARRKVRRFADEFKKKYDRLDVLVNNASEYVPEDDTTEDGFEVRPCNHARSCMLQVRQLQGGRCLSRAPLQNDTTSVSLDQVAQGSLQRKCLCS